MSAKSRDFSTLEDKLGYHFADRSFLERALTHSSAISPGKRIEHSYQRLEFLGDRVLGLAVADMIYARFPKANEGKLSRTLNTLVRRETCAEVARALQLGSYLRLGDSEAKSGGAEKEAILADVCEAVIGAVYCDGGGGKAYDLVERLFGDRIGEANAAGADAKTALQEWAQGRGLEPPTYTEMERSGPDHAPVFTISVAVNGFAPEVAEGASKKVAEHKAAEKLLRREMVWTSVDE